ncbi:retrovirus-related Pol polyprotein from transposon 297 [Trichonephila clavipes]|nr:retrovirus-related Pol polyprotein from transposon 297 [Trichonephila clavipes]
MKKTSYDAFNFNLLTPFCFDAHRSHRHVASLLYSVFPPLTDFDGSASYKVFKCQANLTRPTNGGTCIIFNDQVLKERDCPTLEQPKKKAFWKLSEEEKKAFQTLKQCLVSPPILKQADFSKPFLLRTYASNYALGAVLLQGEDKEEHPFKFASRLLNPAERNYSTTEREALAVVRGYIDGASITVASDHQPLRWLMKLISLTGRLARWALQLQSFNLNMEYIPGKSNVVADMLSRPACHEENELCEVCTVVIDVPSRSYFLPQRS